jgi:hypothetical protein
MHISVLSLDLRTGSSSRTVFGLLLDEYAEWVEWSLIGLRRCAASKLFSKTRQIDSSRGGIHTGMKPLREEVVEGESSDEIRSKVSIVVDV